ncbi:MAG TPA: response regulator, partial [Candidatus Dormibacteraeota bacterium]|nr:response regulator [Candidatus Dormibacteraeota bacterium]
MLCAARRRAPRPSRSTGRGELSRALLGLREAPPADKGRILVIDDEARILEFVARGLRLEGFEVDAVGDPHQGLRAALERHYDLVILDLLMPGLPGISVLDRIV